MRASANCVNARGTSWGRKRDLLNSRQEEDVLVTPVLLRHVHHLALSNLHRTLGIEGKHLLLVPPVERLIDVVVLGAKNKISHRYQHVSKN